MELSQFLAQLLTKEEFHATFACSWIAHAYDALGAEQMTPMEKDIAFGTIANQLLFGIRALSLAGYKYKNLDTDEGGVPRPRDNFERCEGNLAYIGVLAAGLKYDYLKAVETLQEIVSAHGLSLDKHPIKQARAEILETLAAWAKDMSPEEAREIVREKNKRLQTARAILESAEVN